MVAVFGVSAIAAAAPDEREQVVRAGVSWIDAQTNWGAHARGFAPYLDGEIGLRKDHVSLTASGAVFSLRSHYSWSNQDIWVDSDARYLAFDLGFGLTFHGEAHDGPFWGIGAAFESAYETGRVATYECQNDLCDPRTGPGYQAFARWTSVPLGEMHAGFDVQTPAGLVDVIALAGFGGDPDQANGDGEGWMWTLRLAAGLRF